MRDVEALRQQIYRVKGLPTPTAFSLDEFEEVLAGPSSRPEAGPSRGNRLASNTPVGGGRRHMPRSKSAYPLNGSSGHGHYGSGSGMGLHGGSASDEGLATGSGSAGGAFGGRSSNEESAYGGGQDNYLHIPQNRDKSAIPLVIVGTKCDLADDREVSRDMAIRYVSFSFLLISRLLSLFPGTLLEGDVRELKRIKLSLDFRFFLF